LEDGWGAAGANAAVPTAGSTAVGFWTLSSVGWKLERFAERAAVMIIAPAAPNVLLIIVFGFGMGLGFLPGPSDWWLTWLPAAIGIVVVVVAIWAARWVHRLAARTKRRWLREGLHVVATREGRGLEPAQLAGARHLGRPGGGDRRLVGVLDRGQRAPPFAVVAMGYLTGQFAQVIPVPGGSGAIDAGVAGALVLDGGKTSVSTAGEIISHGLALIVPIVVGGVAFALLPGEISRTRRRTEPAVSLPPVGPTVGSS
jgi:hypothetical protein